MKEKHRVDVLVKHLPKKGVSNLNAGIAWYIDMITFLIDLGVKNPDYSELILSNQFAMEIRQLFPNIRVRHKLKMCGGEGQRHLENMLELIQTWLNFDQELQQENDVTAKSVLSSSRNTYSSASRAVGSSGHSTRRTLEFIDDVEVSGSDEDDVSDGGEPAANTSCIQTTE